MPGEGFELRQILSGHLGDALMDSTEAALSRWPILQRSPLHGSQRTDIL